jgi:ketopantoate hydroxymethyltransferase
MAAGIEDAVKDYADDVRARSFPGAEQLYQPVSKES